jgi:hypothetical protein
MGIEKKEMISIISRRHTIDTACLAEWTNLPGSELVLDDLSDTLPPCSRILLGIEGI